ncbi:MAG: hypothetical protein KAR35_10315 [Candidatus Heimdallarchaeota archaeon]|nr:hypothetical protein [Candidatus Heimdallarchaeota archaeon]MCK5049750.1 hypothetical protein [Candidatus Heimdallarchaeota archaeon]
MERFWHDLMNIGLNELTEGHFTTSKDHFSQAIIQSYNELISTLKKAKESENEEALEAVNGALKGMIAFAAAYCSLAVLKEEKSEKDSIALTARASGILDFVNLFVDPVIKESQTVPYEKRQYFDNMDRLSDQLGRIVDKMLEENEISTHYEV